MEEADVFPDASQGDQDIGVTVVKQEEPIDLPKMLKIFAFEKGNISDFPQVSEVVVLFVWRCRIVKFMLLWFILTVCLPSLPPSIFSFLPLSSSSAFSTKNIDNNVEE